MKQTQLYDRHVAAGAKIVDFGGWAMPLHYGSQIDEHHAVRRGAGMFDVSHMTVVDIEGSESKNFLQQLFANDVGRLHPGKGLYSCMLNESGGVIDDLIVYDLDGGRYRVVVNAATRDADLAWMEARIDGLAAGLTERAELAMLAVQGPAARELCAPLLPDGAAEAALALAPFECYETPELFVARTGYTGEDGWEIVLSADAAGPLWNKLAEAGVRPCGLGARDTLRLEAGLNLYGQDMTEATSPLESNLGWTVAWEPGNREFIGRAALEESRAAGASLQLVGLVLEGRGVMRHGYAVQTDNGAGEITSGGFSPTLEQSVALARVPAGCSNDCSVQIRNRDVPARVVRPPFVRHGEKLID